MIKITSNIAQVLSWTDRLSSQYRFAVAMALTETARTVAKRLPEKAEQDLDKPTPFTLRGFFSERATKADLTATVGVKDQQAQYLRYQIYGGDRYPNRKALKLPGEIALDKHGNIPRNQLRRLIAQAKAARRETRAAGGKTSYSGKSRGIFYGQPSYRPELPPGVYQRVESITSGQKRRLIVPIVLFQATSAHYAKRFDFENEVRRIVQREFDGALRRAWATAHATAR